MSDLICLKEIELPHLFHSQLNIPNSFASRYCVLAEHNFIIFKKSTDIISLFRIPINNEIQIESKEKEFTVICSKYKFTFSHQNVAIIKQWISFLNISRKNNIREVIKNFDANVVKIDKLSNFKYPILIGKNDYRLFIYESYNHQAVDICRHIINLKYYPHKAMKFQERSSQIILIKGLDIEFKLTFESPPVASYWINVLQSSLTNYLMNTNDGSILNDIYKNSSNKFCADCNAHNPKWVSINICVTLCDKCAGLHRELGTHISRIQSTVLDEQCWKDSLLLKLINVIGNENANKFWTKNEALSNSLVTISKKYKTKDYIDNCYIYFSKEEILNKLSISVQTDNVVETMRLWFSNKTNFQETDVDGLLKIAKQYQQVLQEKFLLLQQSISKINKEEMSHFEGIFSSSYNNDNTLRSVLVSLFNNKIVIQMDIIVTCVVYLDSINMVCSDLYKDSFEIFVNTPHKFILNENDSIYITQLNLYDETKNTIHLFKEFLLKSLLENCPEILIDETSLFIATEIRINKEELSKCKGYFIQKKLIIRGTKNQEYDLTQVKSITTINNNNTIVINITNITIEIQFCDHCDKILNYLNKILYKLSLCQTATVNKFYELIQFIKIFGLNTKNIFRTFGESNKVEELFSKVISIETKLNINCNDYSVHDVVSCLKKCLNNLYEPLISEDIYFSLKCAAYSEDENERLISYHTAVKLFPKVFYELLKHIIEVFFFIIHFSESSEINSEILARLTFHWIITIGSNNEDSISILKCFIDHFVYLFNYSAEEQSNMLFFISKFKSEPRNSCIRTFIINPYFKDYIIPNFLQSSQQIKLNFLDEINSYILIHLSLINLKDVNDLCTYLFKDFTSHSVSLWHFVCVKNKIFKRLLYSNSKVEKSIIKYTKFPEKYYCGKRTDHFIFLQRDLESNARCLGIYKCEVKIDKVKSEIFLALPNTLKVYKNDDACLDLKLSELSLYRAHERFVSKIYILYSDNIISCDFQNSEVYNTFLNYFDDFLLKNFYI